MFVIEVNEIFYCYCFGLDEVVSEIGVNVFGCVFGGVFFF